MADSKKAESAATAPSPREQQSAAARARSMAKPVAHYTASWVGVAPKSLDPNIDDGAMPQAEIDDILNRPVCVYSYSERDGDKGKFLVVCCSHADSDSLFVIVTGGSVVLKKLLKVGEARGFPVMGRFLSCKGKTYDYYDFV